MIKKAVILAAGLGTRFLPITKTFPKEMLPLIDKPVIQYLVEEAVNSGLKEIIFVISKEKKLIKNYFSQRNKKLEYFLKIRKKPNLLKKIKKINRLVHLSYFYQEKPLGIGDAILAAKKKIKNEPFALFFADDLIESKTPALKQLIRIYQKYQKIILAICPIPYSEVFRYGIIKGKKVENRVYQVLDLIEKPSLKEAPSNLAIVGRYILKPEILKILEKIKPNKDKEVYLTDALKILIKSQPIYGYRFQGKWLSCGNKIGWLKANIKIGLKHPETKEIRKLVIRN